MNKWIEKVKFHFNCPRDTDTCRIGFMLYSYSSLPLTVLPVWWWWYVLQNYNNYYNHSSKQRAASQYNANFRLYVWNNLTLLFTFQLDERLNKYIKYANQINKIKKEEIFENVMIL